MYSTNTHGNDEKLDAAEEWFNRAIGFGNTGELHKAAAAGRCAIKLNPLNSDYYLQLARNLRTLDKCDGAILAIKRALKLRPDDQTAIHLLNTLENRTVCTAPIGCIEALFDHYAATFDHRMNGILNYRVPKILGKSGRFAHSHHYILDLANQHQCLVLTRDTAGIRMDNNRWVNGDIFLLENQKANLG